jgi:hypothetical protein
LSDWPRPFVFRSHQLSGISLVPGQEFSVDLHLFDLREPWIQHFIRSFDLLARDGIGPGRARARLSSVELLDANGNPAFRVFDGGTVPSDAPLAPVVLDLEPVPVSTSRIVVRFLSPTELKGGGAVWDPPEFAVLFARIRDRISTLRALYGSGPLNVDFKGLGERASSVRKIRSTTRRVQAARRSSKTGQVHPLGGFTGEIEYEGELREFLPYLRAGRWTGVGRQTVWGKGAIETSVLEPQG